MVGALIFSTSVLESNVIHEYSDDNDIVKVPGFGEIIQGSVYE